MTTKTIKIATVIGARPQFIKAAAINRAIRRHNDAGSSCVIDEKLIHTGQHYDNNMSKIFFDELEIPRPHYNLEVGSGPHGEQTGKMLQRIESVLLKEEPDFCLVYGDTNSTLAGALTAVKLHIPVAHVEAGLRSFNWAMPEEVNRVLTDRISKLLFCPTKTAVANLANEGITQGVHQTGDVMYDCIQYYLKKAQTTERQIFQRLKINPKSYYLATIHRAENADNCARLGNIVHAFNRIATPDCPVIVPLHPRTVTRTTELCVNFEDSVKVVPPVSYLEMIALESNAKAILTDSGGVQKEAYCLAVPCITLRSETEWVETVESGQNTLVGADVDKIVTAVTSADLPKATDPCLIYGDGDAAGRIVSLLTS